MIKTETVTLEIKTASFKKLLKALKQQDETLTVKKWLELELNTNVDSIIEMLLTDF